MKRIARPLLIAAGVAAGGWLLERYWLAAPRYHGPRSDHFDGDHFRNQDPQKESSFLEWQLHRESGYWPDWVETKAGEPPPRGVSDGRLRVTFINHATLLIQTDGVNILTDPIWSERTSPVSFAGPRRHRAPGIRFEDLPPIDAVILSHNHYDHTDLPTLLRLDEAMEPLFIAPLGNGALLRRAGLRRIEELDWWQTTPLQNGIEVHCVPSKHFSGRGLSDRDRNLWGGFMIASRSGHVYFSGDTAWGMHFEQIAARFPSIRLALLPIGAYLPRWFMQRVHTDPAQAVQAHRTLRARTSIAMHYGTFHLGDDGMEQPLVDLERAKREQNVTNFIAIHEGEGYEVP